MRLSRGTHEPWRLIPKMQMRDGIWLLQMLVGDFEAGWVGREARWKIGHMRDPKFPQPVWSGDRSIEGKTILLYADEGIGDAFQFARYIPMVANLGARVIAAVAGPTCSLVSRLDGVAERVAKTSALPAFNVHCAISSLPLAFKTSLGTIPSVVPYLPAPDQGRVDEWESRLGSDRKFRVGLVWSGNAGHMNDHNRSMSLRDLTKSSTSTPRSSVCRRIYGMETAKSCPVLISLI